MKKLVKENWFTPSRLSQSFDSANREVLFQNLQKASIHKKPNNYSNPLILK